MVRHQAGVGYVHPYLADASTALHQRPEPSSNAFRRTALLQSPFQKMSDFSRNLQLDSVQ
jgi:hypothetical protein